MLELSGGKSVVKNSSFITVALFYGLVYLFFLAVENN